MCGIAGVLRAEGRAADPTVLVAMRRALDHRGPDQAGALVDGPLAMAAARLSLVDLTDAGAQPFADDDAALTFNGEIYNHRSLAAALAAEGVAFRGHSDTEVLFHALGRWGVEATLPRLRGMFAFAYADRRHGTVWLVRDRLGIKPLVWTEHGGDIAWASEAKALAPVRALAVDPVQAVFAVTGRIERSAHLSAFTDVRRLPAGHLAKLQPGHPVTPRPWWRLVDDVDEDAHRGLGALGPEAQADRLLTLLDEATAATSSGDADLATFVSGGVDSALLAALAPERSQALYNADVGGDRSERTAAEEVAAHLGRPLAVAPFPSGALLDDWALATWHAEAPVVTHVNALPFRRLAATARADGVKAALTGEGADELFYGYGQAAAGGLARVATAPVDAVRRAVTRLPGPLGAALARRTTSQADFLVDLAGGFASRHLADEAAEAFSFLPPSEARRHGEVLVWLGDHLPTLLHRNDAMGMAAGLEARFPYLDEDVVAFGINLPVQAKVAVGRRLGDRRHPFLVDKAVVRAAAGRCLPPTIARREKLGFPVHGHDRIRTTRAFWAEGYVVDLLGLPTSAVDHLVEGADPYLAAKLASVEVFGRLFAHGDDVDTVTAHVRSAARCTDQ
ncbi:MAG: asparagine synthase (glutamine-hydrolyzing) [Acidimicrobiales bacterium]|nr:asparagine synthase (glutamine-hydrolyzing) [Acidimicrobiales bacterium]